MLAAVPRLWAQFVSLRLLISQPRAALSPWFPESLPTDGKVLIALDSVDVPDGNNDECMAKQTYSPLGQTSKERKRGVNRVPFSPSG